MKHPALLKEALQAISLVFLALVILLGMVSTLGWAARHNWPALGRFAVFLGGFLLFAIPVYFALQIPYRKPAWLVEAAAHGLPATALLEENPYGGEEWRTVPPERMVSLAARLETGSICQVSCTLGEARELSSGAYLAIRLDPRNPGRAALAG